MNKKIYEIPMIQVENFDKVIETGSSAELEFPWDVTEGAVE